MVLSNVAVVDATATADLPVLAAGLDAANTFAFVVPDAVEPPIPMAAAGEPLTGVEMATLPPTATSAGAVTPAVLPPGGGTALGLLAIQSPIALPSGTIVQTQVTETFTLATGEVASEETRNQDVVLYRLPAVAAAAVSAAPATFQAALSAHFPITPSRAFAPAQLVQGRVHLDVLAGREAVRGQTGGSEPLTLTSGGITLTVPARARTEDTAISLQPAVLSTFLPSAADLQPLAEVMVDLSGATLTMGAELSVSTATLAAAIGASDRFLIARVERIDGVPRLAVVAVADNTGDRIVSRVVFGLSGVTIGGRYVLYRAATPFGFAVATVTGGGTPVAAALVATDRWPFVARTNGAGNATVAAPDGSVRVSAGVPGTALEGSAVVTLAADQMTLVPIALNGTVTSATVTPADGAGAVPPAIQIEVAATAPIAATSVATATVRLTTDGADVAVRRVLAASGRTLAIVPHERLRAATTYRLEVTGLIDIHGSPIAVSPVTFQTLADAALTFNPENLRVSFPDANGLVAVTATAGSLPSGTNVLIVNAGSGEVVTFTVGNDGSLNGSLSATIDHRLIVTVTDPKGQTATFHRTKYVAPDGKTAVGAAGGTIDGPGGIQIRVPEGATDNAVVMKIEPFGADFLPEPPQIPGANFGSGISIGLTGPTTSRRKWISCSRCRRVCPRTRRTRSTTSTAASRGRTAKCGSRTSTTRRSRARAPTRASSRRRIRSRATRTGWNRWNPVGPSLGALGFGMVGMAGYEPRHRHVDAQRAAARPARRRGHLRQSRAAAVRRRIGDAGLRRRRRREADARRSIAGGHPHNNMVMSAEERRVHVHATRSSRPARSASVPTARRAPSTRRRMPCPSSTRRSTATIDSAALSRRGTSRTSRTSPSRCRRRSRRRRAADRDQDLHGKRRRARNTTNLVVAGTPLIIGFTAQNGTVSGATINGAEYAVRVDPLKGNVAAGGMDVILDAPFTPVQPGSYTVTATALAPFGPPVQSSLTFRVIAAGGGTNTAVPGRPGVLTVQPANGARAFRCPATCRSPSASRSPGLRRRASSCVARTATSRCCMSGIVVDADGVAERRADDRFDAHGHVVDVDPDRRAALRRSLSDRAGGEHRRSRRGRGRQSRTTAARAVDVVVHDLRSGVARRLHRGAARGRHRGAGRPRLYRRDAAWGWHQRPNQSGHLRSFDITNAARPEEFLRRGSSTTRRATSRATSMPTGGARWSWPRRRGPGSSSRASWFITTTSRAHPRTCSCST